MILRCPSIISFTYDRMVWAILNASVDAIVKPFRAYARTNSQLKKCFFFFFLQDKILILKHSYLAWCNNITYCPLEVSFTGKNMSFLPQHRLKNGQSHCYHNWKFPFLSNDVNCSRLCAIWPRRVKCCQMWVHWCQMVLRLCQMKKNDVKSL